MLSVTVHFLEQNMSFLGSLSWVKLTILEALKKICWKLGVNFSSVIACGCNKNRHLTVSGLWKQKRGRMVPRELICLQSSWLSVSGAHFGECLCAYCVRSSRGHYSCLMAHFPTSVSCSPVPLRCILIPVTLSFFSLTVYHHMQGLLPPPCLPWCHVRHFIFSSYLSLPPF